MPANGRASQPARTRRTARDATIVKLGGELLEDTRRLRRLAYALVETATRGPVVVIHGGGREVDAEMARLGIRKRSVDGLRITDAATLDVVVGVLAGRVNTRLVAAIGAAGGSAVGLTGADAGISRVIRAPRYHAADGSLVDLGFVGVPGPDGSPALLRDLSADGHVPVVASIGTDRKGRLYNVNADTLAGDVAARVGAKQLLVLGTTAGVLDDAGRTIPVIDDATLVQLIREGRVSAGMIAKLLACQAARQGGVSRVVIADGRRRAALELAANGGGRVTVISGATGRRQSRR